MFLLETDYQPQPEEHFSLLAALVPLKAIISSNPSS
jgi:hypothetical protein